MKEVGLNDSCRLYILCGRVPLPVSTMSTIITLRHLRSFVAVADTGSFTRAAERLFLTQSSLSSTIHQLEEDVGIKLFDRTTRSVTLTPAAMHLHQQAKALLLQFDAMVSDPRAVALRQHGHLRIAAAPSIVAWLLIPSLPRFQAEYPHVTLSVREAGSAKSNAACATARSTSALPADCPTTPTWNTPCCCATATASCAAPIIRWPRRPVRSAGPEVSPYRQDLVGLASDTQIGSLHRRTLQDFDLAEHREEVSSSTSLYPMLMLGRRLCILPRLTALTHQLKKLPFQPWKIRCCIANCVPGIAQPARAIVIRAGLAASAGGNLAATDPSRGYRAGMRQPATRQPAGGGAASALAPRPPATPHVPPFADGSLARMPPHARAFNARISSRRFSHQA